VRTSNPPLDTAIRPYGKEAIDAAAALVLAGRPVAIPTETVYGLAADATSGDAVAAIYAAKGRPSFNPLIVHVRDLDQARALGVFDPVSLALAERFWPGPLTLVVPRAPDCPVASLATAGLGTIALRCPAHPAMQDLLAASGRPLAAPSANASGSISPTRAAHVAASLSGRIALVVDGGPTQVGIESTIVAAGGGAALRLLRSGPVTAAALTEMTGLSVVEGSDAVEAPGQLPSHYAPVKPLRIDVADPSGDDYVIGFGGGAADEDLSPSGDFEEAAARLFDALHRADASNRTAIAVRSIPAVGLGVAINDRLQRAAWGTRSAGQ
jgi:L-threonylcarbamoyladenylate synthase